MSQIVQEDLSNTTKRDQLRDLKRLVHFVKTGDLIVKSNNNAEYCDEVAWITPGQFRGRFEKIRSNDLVTNDEFMAGPEVTRLPLWDNLWTHLRVKMNYKRPMIQSYHISKLLRLFLKSAQHGESSWCGFVYLGFSAVQT